MPLTIVGSGEELKTEDEAALLAEFEAFNELNPDNRLSFEEWLSMRGEL